MGICPCTDIVFLNATLKQDNKSHIIIEDLDQNEDKVLHNAKEITLSAQRMINTTFQQIACKSATNNIIDNNNHITNNIIINNIIIIPQYKRHHSDNESYNNSENSNSSLALKRRPIFEKLLSKKSH
jgi:hypothetical protein